MASIQRETDICIISVWEKDGKRCRIYSHRKRVNHPNTCSIRVTGDNPFPCYEMKTTFNVVRKWMEENGWKRNQWSRFTELVTETNSETGELISMNNNVREYIPVRI